MGKNNSRPRSDAVAEELEKIQGTWRQVAHEREGVVSPPDELGREPRVTFVGNTFAVRLGDGTIAIKGTFELDPSRTPKAVDWTDTFGPDAGKTFLAIYTLEADRLVFCAADEGLARPTVFRTGLGQDLRVSERE
jgi:uncharacterized protein (TIGR03067 family)